MPSKRLFAVLILTFAFLALLPLSGAFAANDSVGDSAPQPPAEVLGPNLLTNPGMDGQYVKQCALRNGQPWVQVPCPADYNSEVSSVKQWETVQVPSGWSAWWRAPSSDFNDPNFFNNYPAYCPNWKSTPFDCKAWHNPEYRDTMGGPQETGPSRKVAGDNSQKYFTFYSVHEAGLYQVVSGVKPGDHLRFSVYMEEWTSGGNDPYHSDHGQRMNLQVGIDPTGGNDPWSPNIIWTAPTDSYDVFTKFTVDAIAKNNVVSVWTKSRPEMALQHNDVYVDEASLNVVQSAKTAAPSRVTRATKIITSTKVITSTRGITSTVIVTRTIYVTIPLTGTLSTTPFSGTVAGATATPFLTGTLPIPASGTYTVVKGDSLSKIARRFGVPLATLIALNHITNPNRIEPGMVLLLK